MIPRRIPWTRKPPPDTPLNPGHPLARHLRCGWAMHSDAREVTGRSQYDGTPNLVSFGPLDNSMSGTTDKNTDKDYLLNGPVANFQNTGGARIDVPIDCLNVSEGTIIADAFSRQMNSSQYFWDTDGSRFLLFRSSENLMLYFGSTNRITWAHPYGSGGQILEHWNVAVTWGGANVELYHLGERVATGAADDPTGASGDFIIGSRYTDSSQWKGNYNYLFHFDRVLTAAEIKSVYEDPWALFMPRTVWIPVAAEAGALFPIKRGWTEQPPDGTPINDGHPLARNLYAAVRPSANIGIAPTADAERLLIQTDKAPLGAVPWVDNTSGQPITIVGASSRFNAKSAIDFDEHRGEIEIIAADGDDTLHRGNISGFAIFRWDGHPTQTQEHSIFSNWIQFTSVSKAEYISAGLIEDGEWHSVAWAVEESASPASSDRIRVWIDGKSVADTTTGITSTDKRCVLIRYDAASAQLDLLVGNNSNNTDGVRFWGTPHTSNDEWSGEAGPQFVWQNRLLTDADAKALHDNVWQLYQPRTIWLPGAVAEGGDISLVVQEALLSMTSDNVALTQANTLAMQEALMSMTSDNVVVTVDDITLSMQEALLSMTADNLDLVQQNTLAVQEALMSMTADNIELDVAGTLDVAEALMSLSADNVDLTQANTLDVQESLLSMTSETPSLVQQNILAIDEALMSMTSDEPTLSTVLTLDVASALQSMSADNTVLTQANVLSVAEAAMAMTAAGVDLTQAHVLAVDDALLTLLSDVIPIGDVPIPADHVFTVQREGRSFIIAPDRTRLLAARTKKRLH